MPALDEKLQETVAELEQHRAASRALVMLALAERWRGALERFDERAGRNRKICDILDRAWRASGDAQLRQQLMADLEATVPGEDWIVDGYFDAIAQHGGNLIAGALDFFAGNRHGAPEVSAFEILRLALSVYWNGVTDLGSGEEDELFEQRLVADARFGEEVGFLREALCRAQQAEGRASELRRWAASQPRPVITPYAAAVDELVENWRPPVHRQADAAVVLVFTTAPGTRPSARSYYGEDVTAFVADFLGSRIECSSPEHAEGEASFLYVVLSRVPDVREDDRTVAEGGPIIEFGFGQAPAAPADWEVLPLSELMRSAVRWLRSP